MDSESKKTMGLILTFFFKSAGPATCCLVVYREEDAKFIKTMTDKPVTHIGIIERR